MNKKKPAPSKQKRQNQKDMRLARRREQVYFNTRIKNATDEKAPETLRTKSYYRFAKNYPSKVDSEGFRENEKLRPNGRKRAIILTVVSCIVVFAAAFSVTKIATYISKIPIANEATATDALPDLIMQFMDADAFSDNPSKLITEMTDNSVNCAVIEVKSPDGTIPFDLEGKALRNTIIKLAKNGIKSAAYISCFKDTAYAVANPAQAVHSNSAEGEVLINKDGFGYINPFSEEGVEYVCDIIRATAGAGFDFIILDEITLPVNTGKIKPYYEGYTGEVLEKNNKLLNALAVFRLAGNGSDIILMSDIYGFVESDDVTGDRYEGNFNSSGCLMRAVDLRVSEQNTKGKDPLGLLGYIKNLPTVFMLDAAEAARNSVDERTILFAVCESKDDIQYVNASGINNIIITGK